MVNSNKIIQIPIDEELLADLDQLTKEEGSSRSAIIRRACREYLGRVREGALDRQYQRGYQRVPEEAVIGDSQAKLAAQVLPEESW
jgi:metal-responsive CopG/Arc/MetJ family transcriptional regulator